MSEVKYQYFVAYAIKNGFGNHSITSDEPIESMKNVREIEEIIKKDNKDKELVVINWILLSKEPK